jgi:type II secretory pathway predicted ATPase ExeA
MLSNLNLGSTLVLQIILSGQPQLLENLRKPELEQFVQRIGINYHLKALELGDSIEYIRHRLAVAGGNPGLFDDLACTAAHIYAGGIPRLINILCDLALVYSYAENRHQIEYDTIVEVAESREAGGLSPFRPELADKSRAQIRDVLWRQLATIAPDEQRAQGGGRA